MLSRFLIVQLLVLLLFSAVALAQELTPELYLQIDIEARQATQKGMEERIALLQKGRISLSAEAKQNAATEQSVNAVYSRYGSTPADHAAYAAQNNEAIVAFLDANLDYQAAYRTLNSSFEELSATLNSLVGR